MPTKVTNSEQEMCAETNLVKSNELKWMHCSNYLKTGHFK